MTDPLKSKQFKGAGLTPVNDLEKVDLTELGIDKLGLVRWKLLRAPDSTKWQIYGAECRTE